MENTNVTKRIMAGRMIYVGFIAIFFLAIVLQFLFAGMAVFISPIHWMKHTMFVHFFGFNIPLFLLLFAYIGKLPRWAYWHVFGLLLGVFAMYFTANFTSVSPWVGAIHPVAAILLLIISFHALKKSIHIILHQNEQKGRN